MRNETRKYGVMAATMVLFLIGGLLLIDHMALVNLAGAVLFCAVCAAFLLFCLMKMDVMEFQPGSFWYQQNRRVNREESPAASGRQAARSTVYAMVMNK